METVQSYQRLNLQIFANTDGTIDNWRLVDRDTHKVIIHRGGKDALYVFQRFLKNERVEALLCAEIDREWPLQDAETG